MSMKLLLHRRPMFRPCWSVQKFLQVCRILPAALRNTRRSFPRTRSAFLLTREWGNPSTSLARPPSVTLASAVSTTWTRLIRSGRTNMMFFLKKNSPTWSHRRWTTARLRWMSVTMPKIPKRAKNTIFLQILLHRSRIPTKKTIRQWMRCAIP